MSDSVNISYMLKPGVYVLLLGAKVVFVGRGKDLIAKVHAHHAYHRGDRAPAWMPAAPIKFDGVKVRNCTIDQLEETYKAVCDEVGWQPIGQRYESRQVIDLKFARRI